MKKRTVAAAVLLAASTYALPVQAQERLARFEGGIGSQPLRSGGTPNVVQNVNPGGIPWVISRLSADIATDGRISVDGRGLLLGGGNNVGRTGGNSVHARLFCGAVPHNSATVDLGADGDFRIEGQLDPIPPNPCSTPVLLIVSGPSGAVTGSWFAAGIPKQ